MICILWASGAPSLRAVPGSAYSSYATGDQGQIMSTLSQFLTPAADLVHLPLTHGIREPATHSDNETLMVFGASHSFNLSRYFSSTQVKSLHQVCSAERYIWTSINESVHVDMMGLVVTVHSYWCYHQSYHLHLGRYRYRTRVVDLRSRWLRGHTRLKVACRFLAAWVWAVVIVQQAMVRLIDRKSVV